MNFFMIHLQNIQIAFENVFVLVFYLMSLRLRKRIENEDRKNDINTLDDLKMSNYKSEEILKQETEEENPRINKICNHQKAAIDCLEMVNDKTMINDACNYHQLETIDCLEIVYPSFLVNNIEINKNLHQKKEPDPIFENDFNKTAEQLTTDKISNVTIKERMFNYHSVKKYWESISQINK